MVMPSESVQQNDRNDVWYHVFWSAYHSLGDRFTRNNLEAMLESQYGR